MKIDDIEVVRLFILGLLTDLTNNIEWSVGATAYDEMTAEYNIIAETKDMIIHSSSVFVKKHESVNVFDIASSIERVIAETMVVFSDRMFIDEDARSQYRRSAFYKNIQSYLNDQKHGEPIS